MQLCQHDQCCLNSQNEARATGSRVRKPLRAMEVLAKLTLETTKNLVFVPQLNTGLHRGSDLITDVCHLKWELESLRAELIHKERKYTAHKN